MRTPTPASNWIVSTSLDKPDAATRRAMRRHVMRNKNTRKSRQTAQLKQLMQRYDTQWQAHMSLRLLAGDEADWIPLSPRQVASELACFDFGFDIKPYMLDLIHRAFTIIKPTTYTIDNALVGERKDGLLCFENLPNNPVMMHAIIHTAQTYHDVIKGQPLSVVARYHLAKALHHLQLELHDSTTAEATITMAAVMSLATAAAVMGDITSLVMHMDGLYRMVMLRGGLESLGSGSMILHKAQRLDLGIALATGAPPRFFNDVSWDASIALECATQCPELAMLGQMEHLDDRLLNVFADLREFSRAANQSTKTGVKMSPGFFNLLTDTVPYRLLSLQYEPTSISEMLRLCMLAYTKGLLINTPGLGKSLVYLHTALKTALVAQMPGHGPFMLWAFFVAGLVVFEDFDRDFIQRALVGVLNRLKISTWDAARAELKRFLWADLAYDQMGQRLFNEVLPSTSFTM